MPAFDYRLVADLYDSYCRFDEDLDFFRRLAAETEGPILELMAGTGRVTLPLAEAGGPVVAVDLSLPMLEVLRRKLAASEGAVQVVCCDVRALPFGRRFPAAVWPFHGISELADAGERLEALRQLHAVLDKTGLLVLTLHNPAIRQRTIDGRWHDYGTHRRPGNGTIVTLSGRFAIDPDDGSIAGTQRVEVRSRDGELVELREFPIRFCLPSRADIEREIEAAGFEIEELWGDYDASPFDLGTSPYILWKLRKRR